MKTISITEIEGFSIDQIIEKKGKEFTLSSFTQMAVFVRKLEKNKVSYTANYTEKTIKID
jgi:hypothetical protein